MAHRKASYIIAYDIADPERLRRVHDCVQARALSLQYSVFVGRLASEELESLLDELGQRIDPKQDDVRIYRLPPHARPAVLGKKLFPDGLLMPEEVFDLFE